MKLTRHAAMWMSDTESIPQDEMVDLDLEVSEFLWPLLGDYQEIYTPFASRCVQAIYSYLFAVDPIGIRDDQAQNTDEYLHEARAIFWLLKNDRLTTKAIWAIFIFYFDREISPFKVEDDPMVIDIFNKSREIYTNESSL